MKNNVQKIFTSLITKISLNLKKYKSGVKCPICKSRYIIFNSFGSNSRINAQCPSCKSLERHRLLWLYLHEKESIKNLKNLKILHFAPEKVFYDLFSKSDNFEYYPVDLFPEIYQYEGDVKISRADITDIPFEDNFFDIILCNHVLEHIPDDLKAMSELHRVLKKGGFGIFQVPIDNSRDVTYENFKITKPEERRKEFGQEDHVRWYGRDYPKKLRSVNFKVKEENFVKTFNAREKYKYGLMENEIIYRCSV